MPCSWCRLCICNLPTGFDSSTSRPSTASLGHGRELIGSFGEFHDLHLAEERDRNQAWTIQQNFCTCWANNLCSCNTDRWTVRPFPHEHLLVHLLCVEAWVFIFPPDIIFLPGIILVLAAKSVAFRQRHLRRCHLTTQPVQAKPGNPMTRLMAGSLPIPC